MTPGVSHGARVRAYLAGVVVSLGLTGVAWKAWALQISDGDRYRALADHQHEVSVEIPAPRGDVVDAVGRPLAVSADTDSIWANPREIKDVTETAAQLAKLLKMDANVLEAKLGTERHFVWLERHVSAEVARTVREAKLPGIEVAKEPHRWYPGRAIAGPVIGRADIDGNGLDGIELAMNAQLAGSRTETQALRDARGRKMFADGITDGDPGAVVHLSLDRSIEAIAEAAIADAVTANKAKSGVAVVLEVATSRVLALASYPTYDPNTGEGVAQGRDRAVTDAYEAGSVMKVFSIATALDDGVVEPDTMFDLGGGQLMLKGRKNPIRDVHPDAMLTVAGIIKRSSNVGAAKIALRMGRDKLYAGLKRFGFGQRTHIELPGEQTGMLRDGAKWREVELATIAFGYGLTVTPLQVSAAFAALGNGGMYREPRIVDQVVAHDGRVSSAPPVEPRRVVSEQTAAQMIAILASVFDKGKLDGGTAKDINVPGFHCGGKTGTANKYDPTTKEYAPDRYLSSFAGLAPIDHPRIVVVVMVDEATGADHYGASVAGPAFAKVASETLRYLGVPGDNVEPAPVAKPHVAAVMGPADELEAFRGLGVARAVELARTRHLAVDLEGSGKVIGWQRRGPRLLLRFSDGNPRPAPVH